MFVLDTETKFYFLLHKGKMIAFDSNLPNILTLAREKYPRGDYTIIDQGEFNNYFQ